MGIGVVIVAAGNGTRMGRSVRKAYLELGGIPLIIRTIQRFIGKSTIQEIVLVVHQEEIVRTNQLLDEYRICDIHVIAGGTERQESVELGINRLSDAIEYVLIHDGARPFISDGLIDRLIDEVQHKGALVPGVKVKDTIKVVHEDNRIAYTPERKSLWAVQTPQAFRLSILKESYAFARRYDFLGTDDASLLEKMGQPVYIVEGEYTNIKITTPEDLCVGEEILRRMEEKE